MKLQLTLIVTLTALGFAAASAFAGSAQWNLSPTTGDWNTATNWTPATVPNGPSDTATFATSNTTGVSISDFTEVSNITFNSGTNPFTVTATAITPVSGVPTLTISGAGIVNNSGVIQNFFTADFNSTTFKRGAISFKNSATAGSLTAFTNGDGLSSFGGFTYFFDSSTAGNATFTNSAGDGVLQYLECRQCRHHEQRCD